MKAEDSGDYTVNICELASPFNGLDKFGVLGGIDLLLWPFTMAKYWWWGYWWEVWWW